MCICCCTTRKILIIYGIAISGIAFIYEIVVIYNFASITNNYKILMKEFELYETFKELDVNNLEFYYDIYDYYLPNGDIKKFFDRYDSDYTYVETYTYRLLKKLKGIENGFVIPFFIFTIIFLAAEIVYLYFAYGISEYQLLKEKTYKVLNILKIISFFFSIILVPLNICFTVLAIFAFFQYINFPESFDDCLAGMLLDIFLGIYNIYFYLNLIFNFFKELTLFRKVGSDISPGENAAYDLNGNQITRTAQGQQIIGINQQMLNPNINLSNQQVRIYNNQAQETIPTGNEEQIQQNQVTQEQLVISQNPTSSQRIGNKEARDNNA